MLTVDLGLLGRTGRFPIEVDVPADASLAGEAGLAFDSPIRIRLDVQLAGADVVVRGRLSGVATGECRRCLQPVRTPVETTVTLLYRPGLSAVDAEDAEVYRLPERERTLDLEPALHEHLILAVPEYVLCKETCAGLCPNCGTDRNLGPCACEMTTTDPRWAALRSRGN